MKHVKSFKLYENINSELKSFGSEEHSEFCQVVAEWQGRTSEEVRWCLYRNLLGSGKNFWDMYVKDGVEAALIEQDGKLILFMHKDGEIIHGWGDRPMAFDNMDFRLKDVSSLEALI